jgi:UDPglucose 6-dehydrogenase
MKIAIIGTGYVGLVSGACFADVGNSVICVDVDASKIESLNAGRIPIHEPGLEALVQRNKSAGRISFTTSYDLAIDHANVLFLAVGTPPGEDGGADLTQILSAAMNIGQRITKPVLVVNKSTVPVGTADAVRKVIQDEVQKRGLSIEFGVVSNPEFLKEGAAIEDFMRPDRIVIGSDSIEASRLMRQLYAPFSRNHDKLIEMDIRSAELTKYASNAMLAMRISFVNELANLAETLGADIEAVRLGMGSDSRIGTHFLYAGAGYGGSCFPKDVKALLKTADEQGKSLRILREVEAVNNAQKEVLFEKLCRHFDGPRGLEGKTIALWGLSFKPNTNDMREAPSLILIRRLLETNCFIRAYDPVAADEAYGILRSQHGERLCNRFLTIVPSGREAVQGSDALAIVTEWKEFRSPDFEWLSNTLRERVVFDGRNLYDPLTVRAAGLTYYGVGRPLAQ